MWGTGSLCTRAPDGRACQGAPSVAASSHAEPGLGGRPSVGSAPRHRLGTGALTFRLPQSVLVVSPLQVTHGSKAISGSRWKGPLQGLEGVALGGRLSGGLCVPPTARVDLTPPPTPDGPVCVFGQVHAYGPSVWAPAMGTRSGRCPSVPLRLLQSKGQQPREPGQSGRLVQRLGVPWAEAAQPQRHTATRIRPRPGLPPRPGPWPGDRQACTELPGFPAGSGFACACPRLPVPFAGRGRRGVSG